MRGKIFPAGVCVLIAMEGGNRKREEGGWLEEEKTGGLGPVFGSLHTHTLRTAYNENI